MKASKLNEYIITYHYAGQVSVRVMAECEEDAGADPEALEQADERIACNLHVSNLSVKRAKK